MSPEADLLLLAAIATLVAIFVVAATAVFMLRVRRQLEQLWTETEEVAAAARSVGGDSEQ